VRALRRVPWSTLLLLGGSFAMAAGIEGSGLSKWIALQFHGVAGMPLAAQIGLATGGTVALSAVASNTATVNVALNVLPPAMPVLAATMIAASCDFMLPAGTPPNAIVFGSGAIRLPVMMKTGFVLDLLAVVVITVYMLVYGRLLF
jgi:sodium-dependent dicarboxylate transporter 2/3/5